MAKTRVEQKEIITDVDSVLFGLPDETANTVFELNITDLYSFFDHTFQPLREDKYLELKTSIQNNGIISPIEVRKREQGGYEIILGHNRVNACKDLGLKTVPSILRELTDDEARTRMIDSNIQRDLLYPSELAYSYKMKLEIANRQGKRIDLKEFEEDSASVQKEQKSTSRELIAKELGVSPSAVQRYIRLTFLTKPLLQLIDDKKLLLNVGVDISYLKPKEQDLLYQFISEKECKISVQQSAILKKSSKEKTLTKMAIGEILFDEESKKKKRITLKHEDISAYFPDKLSGEEIISEILQLLKNNKNKYNK